MEVPNDNATTLSAANVAQEKDETPCLEDWTSTLPVTEGTRFFKSIDWAATSLGQLQTWSAALRFAVNLLFADSRGAAIYWGDERVAIYNEVYKPMAGQAHPNLMGKPFYVGYPELWANISPIFDQVQATGLTTDVDNIELFTDRNGYNEETYFIGQFIPLRGDDGRVVGCYNTVYESTFSVIQLRRRSMINELAAVPDCDLKESNDLIQHVLKTNGRDVPMALLYSLNESTRTKTQLLQLQLNIGVQVPDRWVPALTDVAVSEVGIVPYLRSAYERKTMILVPSDSTLTSTITPLLEEVEWSGFGEPSKGLVIAPLISAGNVLGFMVMGTNCRRKFDDSCRQFFDDVALQVAAKWASAFTVEQTKAREARLVRNLEERERRIRYMAQSAPVGMLHLTVEGSIAWANQHYFDIMVYSPPETALKLPFLDCVLEDDQPIIYSLWETLKSGVSADCQARLKRNYQPPMKQKRRRGSIEASPAWVMVQGFPLKDEEELELIMICFTDISGPKWAESVQHQAVIAAEKSKRQQEEFIDITSHEMRNPLSAIMQSAQAISTGLRNAKTHLERQDFQRIVEEAVEAAETILSCSFYQKRIIDDVLMLSRLENDMLSISPAITDPLNLIRGTLKMLDGDVKSADIRTTITRHTSLAKHKIGNVFCDPSRLAQVLTNLFSNAFKFTRAETTRVIEITCAASLQVPIKEESIRSLQWSSSGKDREDLTLLPEWGEDETIYIYILIRDTGLGMTQQEIERLFARFSQATPSIHVKHGGSGLGLYIARELIEKHGGQIGVQSTPGEGSAFGFYVKTRRAPELPPQPLDVSRVKAKTLPVMSKEASQLSVNGEAHYEVLLVEDNLINQRVLSRQLRQAGCVVRVAQDGVEALEILEKSDPLWLKNGTKEDRSSIDVILMDWNMPNMDGVTCTRRIRSKEREEKTEAPLKIIGITANARPEQLLEARNAGMDDVLSKPFLLADLVAKINTLVVK